MLPEAKDKRFHFTTLTLFVFAVIFLWRECLANDNTDQLVNQINYAYANYLGTGVYSAADREVQVYSMPFSHQFREAEENRPEIIFRLPVTIGFLNFNVEEIVEEGLPDRLETLTFVPGIALRYQLYDNWSVMPFFDVGIGHDLVTSHSALVYGTGVKSVVTFDNDFPEIELYNELLYAGNSTRNEAKKNDFSRFETGLNFRFPMNFKLWERRTALSFYVINFSYFDSLDFIRFVEEDIEINSQNEIGVTLDTFPDMSITKINFSRVGLSVRGGDGLYAIRLVFGSPF